MMLLRRTGVSHRALQWCDARGKLKVKAKVVERTMLQKRNLCTPVKYPVQKFDYLLFLDFEATCDNIKTPYPQVSACFIPQYSSSPCCSVQLCSLVFTFIGNHRVSLHEGEFQDHGGGIHIPSIRPASCKSLPNLVLHKSNR